MAAKYDPEREAHKAWLGLLQPVGLVVSPPALMKAQAVLDRNIAPVQQRLDAVCERPPSIVDDPDPQLLDFPRFATDVLGWQLDDLAGAPGGPEMPSGLSLHLPQYNDTLTPDYAAVDDMGDGTPLMLVSVVERGLPLDKPLPDDVHDGWMASPQARLERLLRETAVPAGLLLNGDELRLVYAPRGESSGHVGFPVAEMCTVHGRPILAALHMLLSEHRVFAAPDGQRLLDLLVESRKFQNEVSTRLADQVLGALWDLLRGFQAADDAARGRVLFDLARAEPDHIYGGVLTTIMRLVFLLYAEDQGLMPDDPTYARHYSVSGLFDQLRADAGRYPDTMDQRFGAWSRLLSTFRLIYDGGSHGALSLPTRHGQLFDPDAYPFLEGRPIGVGRVIGERFDAPRVSDGVLWRVLDGLLMLDGERLSYRALDVEQIGSVYEAMMGFDVKTLPGRAIAVRPHDIVVDLDDCLKQPPAKRKKWLEDAAETKLGRTASAALKASETVEDIVAALDRKVSPRTPRPLPPGALFLQPGEERRRSGSHYTPRELTEPIVRTTLRPVLDGLGEKPTPEQILDLKVCDPAMGSGAFLVEACRQLAEALVEAWTVHGRLVAEVPAGEEPLLVARRRVAQRCLYGVDKNPFAVNLAKLSLWLVTLSRDHAFTFLDHALKCGDSLVGLKRSEISAFDWSHGGNTQTDWIDQQLRSDLQQVLGWRTEVFSHGGGGYDARARAWQQSEAGLDVARLIGDLCIAAFFSGLKAKGRDALRHEYLGRVTAWLRGDKTGDTSLREIVKHLRGGAAPIAPFHWSIEFPEVFGRDRSGFDAIVANPPFLGGTRISVAFGLPYRDWVSLRFRAASQLTDLCAYFFRGAWEMIRRGGCAGLVATNSIAQGDTRETGLGAIRAEGGTIYAASRRVRWPGMAAVVVSIVHFARHARLTNGAVLDGQQVSRITAYLFHAGNDEPPRVLRRHHARAVIGSFILGIGFVFDDRNSNANALESMHELLKMNPSNAECISPYFGGSDLNSLPELVPQRFLIDFKDMDYEQASRWPDLLDILKRKVRPARASVKQRDRRELWWLHATRSPELRAFCASSQRFFALSQVSQHLGIVALEPTATVGHTVVAFLYEAYAAFCLLQSRPHEVWVRFFGSSLEERLRYTPSDCFETFPFPADSQIGHVIENAGDAYYGFRADLMIRNDEGMTATYNRFHDPDEHDPEIIRLRELHAEMDRAVLDAYGWTDIPTDCEFLLDYEIDEETWGNKKKPYRYRWPDEVHDEVLARLLDLNQQRYEEEVAAGLHAKGKKRAKKAARPRKKAPPKPKPIDELPLFQTTEGSDS